MSIATAFPPDYPRWRKWFAYAIFPIAFVACIVTPWALMQQGVTPTMATIAAAALAVAFVVSAEWTQPHSEIWARSVGDVGADLTHNVVSQLIVPRMVDAGLHIPLVGVAAWITAELDATPWPDTLPIVVQLYMSVLIYDLIGYAWHRLCHEHSWFWRWHAVHHSAERLYWFNAGRFHPLDTAISHALSMVPLILLGTPPQVLVMTAAWVIVHGLFQHSNVELRLGPLNYIFSMAELHRWHHSRALRDQNANYGNNVILWDLLFRTFHFPQDRAHQPEDVGFDGIESYPKTWLGHVAAPFRESSRR